MAFRPNKRGIGDLLRSEKLEAELVRRAELVKAQAEATAPYDPESKDGTHYRDAFRVESTRHGGVKHDRAIARVVNDDPAAFYIEFGNRNITRHRTLGRSLDAAGER